MATMSIPPVGPEVSRISFAGYNVEKIDHPGKGKLMAYFNFKEY